ncbi:MAG: hypothetical protein ACFCUS_03360 [Rubrimonas sp.]|uniref:hypothetical protein n=1 Tax=Rubrimonas sp. TaxID=2036015 RepID=UPI002FDE5011
MRLRRVASFGLAALLLASCGGLGPREAPRGALMATFDHGADRVLPPEAPPPISPEGYTELRYLGLAGSSAILLQTSHAPDPAATDPAPELPRVSTSVAVDLGRVEADGFETRRGAVVVRRHRVELEDVRPEAVRYRVRPAGGA